MALEKMLQNMVQCDGDPSEGWRNPNGFWGNVVQNSGLSNTDSRRRVTYDLWHKNWAGLQERFWLIQNSHEEDEVNEQKLIRVEPLFSSY